MEHSPRSFFGNVLMVFCVLSLSIQAQAQNTMQQVTEHIYRFGDGFFFGAVVVGEDGLIVIDPLNRDVANWLKPELKKRFDLPVKYVVYSHDHANHITGADIFTDTAIVVAHENAAEQVIGEKRSTAIPNIGFKDYGEIFLEGATLRMYDKGQNHGISLIYFEVPEDRAVITIDIVTPVRVPPDLRDMHYHGSLIAWNHLIHELSYDVLIPGHGRIGDKQDVIASRNYFTTLHNQVLQHIRADKKLDEIKRLVDMSVYSHWHGYHNNMSRNIEDIHHYIMSYRDRTPMNRRQPYPPPGPIR